MNRLIINADDFGYGTSKNEAIKELLEKNIITSTTVMMNQPGTEDALQYARNCTVRSFGVHLNLSEGPFVSNPEEELRYRVNYNEFRWSFLRENYSAYIKEIDCQIKMATTNYHVTHLDGHFHIHTFPLLWWPIMRSARKHGIHWLRRPYTYFERDKIIKAAGKNMYGKLLSLNGLSTTNYFFDLSYFLMNVDQALHLPEGSVIEVMCHPDLSAGQDYELLKSAEVRKIFKRFDLISFNRLEGAS